MATTNLPIERKRGDTKRIIFKVKDDTGAIVPIGGWTAFLLTVDPVPNPVDDSTKVLEIVGALISDGSDGRVGFTPDGQTDIGVYFYDAQALDDNSEKITFAEGQYTLTQDISKV